MNATYANQVIINIYGYYGSQSCIWSVKYAQDIGINVDGRYGAGSMVNSLLDAEFAGSLVMNLAANGVHFSSANRPYYYLAHNTTLNCYGRGFYYLYTLDRTSSNNANGLILNVNGCNRCDTDNCIYIQLIWMDSLLLVSL